jgi:hypothetical protein
LKEEALPTEWVNDYLMPPFRDAAPQDAAPGGPDDTLQMDEGVAGNFWCGDFWDASSMSKDGLQLDALHDILNGEQFCLPGIEQQRLAGLSPLKVPGPAACAVDTWRLPTPSLPPTKLDVDGDCTPRTQSGDNEADDSSTSAGEDLLGTRASAETISRWKTGTIGMKSAGIVGGGGSAGGSSSASSSPWMIPSNQEPSWGPFGGAFDGYPQLLTAVANSRPIWDPSEPARVS